jgi:transcriptional regulator with XRE-family HTH domain
MSVGTVLKAIRRRRKLSQKKLGLALNVSQREICFVEQDQRKNIYMIGRLLQFYKLSEDEIEDLIWAQVSDFLISVGLPDTLAEKIKYEHSCIRRHGRGIRVKKIMASFKEETE